MIHYFLISCLGYFSGGVIASLVLLRRGHEVPLFGILLDVVFLIWTAVLLFGK